jgi:ferredoxin-type protein NapF
VSSRRFSLQWKHLKPIRIAVSLFCFASLCLLYFDIAHQLPLWFPSFWSSLQLFPSLLKILFISGITAAGLYFVLLLTALFGRVYCSGICPLGIYQDFIIRLSRLLKKKRWFSFRVPMYSTHYGILALLLVTVLSGSVLLLNFLEPFSLFGRIAHTLFRPVLVLLNNGFAWLLTGMDIFILFPVQLYDVTISVLAIIITCTAALTVLAFYQGRLFCNLLCPAGAVLGIMSRWSVFTLVINEETCTHCKLCEKVCKAQCIDSSNQSIDFAACVGCFNCMDACHTDGVVYRLRWKKGGAPVMQPLYASRRRLLKSTMAVAASVIVPQSLSSSDTLRTASGFDESRKHPITPPGSKGTEHFSSQCTACQLCVSSCPTGVLQPAFLDYGIAGILQPKMRYDVSYCNYDCTVCTEICPTGAILPLAHDEKKLVQMGKAKFFKDDCIVITKKKDCGACSEHCPTKAVNMVPYEGGIFLPEVNEKICTGCGGCEHACPTVPRKAIYVEANPVHLTAEKPKIQKPKASEQSLEEFPF